MDELITEVNSLNIGIEVGDTKVSILVFVDDLVLLTQNQGDMQVLLDRATRFFDDHGLKVNAQKCQSLLAEAVSGKRNHKVSTNHHRWWKGEPLPSLTFDSLAKYLGWSLTRKAKSSSQKRNGSQCSTIYGARHSGPIKGQK